jgi:hypothetical protein
VGTCHRGTAVVGVGIPRRTREHVITRGDQVGLEALAAI